MLHTERKKRRGETPGQENFFDGVLGYVNNMRGYRVWDIKKKKIREISYNFTVISEGFFPFRDKNFGLIYKKKFPYFFTLV